MRYSRIKAAAAAIMLSLTSLPFSSALIRANAADTLKFDLGANVQSGWTSVSDSQRYDKSKGYGFSSGSDIKNVSAAGQGALNDAVQFTGNTTFNVDLSGGLYRVKVTLGNTSRTSVYMENMLQIVNMTGNNAVDEILIPVTDGQLNIRAGAGKSGTAFSISAIEITKVSDDPTLPPTIWICGDSTVCNYYPLNTSVQGGWGQMLSHYVDSGWNVRNMAASGQYAQGFVQAGQFTPIETYGKSGDVYIISIGINDSKYYKGDVYQQVVQDMVQRAKKKGMTVILVKQQGRNGDAQRNPLLGSRWYAGELDNAAKAEGCQVVDLFNLWQNYCISIGADKTTALYMNGDTLHPNRAGAEKLAELFASQFRQTLPSEITIADGTLIKSLEVNDKTNRYSWSVQQGLDSGKEVFGDRSCKFTSVPDMLKGTEWIRTSCDSKKFTADEASFTAAKDISVYLGIDTRAEGNAAWLSGWTKTSLTLTDDGSPNVTYNVYKRDAKSGEKVTLGAVNMTSAVNYVVAATEYNESTVTEPTPQIIDNSFIYGDLDYNGRVDVFDMILMRRELVDDSLDRQTKRRADVDADGKITVADAVQLQSFLLNGKYFSAVNEKRMFAYAVDQTISEGIEESTNSGFRDTAYVNLDNKVGSNIEWKITAPIDGNYLCTFGTANGSADNRKMKIEVNGQADYWVQDFLTTGAWTTWQERGIVLPLKSGENVIKMTSETASGGPNLDYLHIEWTDEPIAQVYEEQPEMTTPVQSNVSRTVYIAGDSTVQTYNAKYAPQQGWGAYLGENLSDKITVSNHAIAGRSSKSFYDNGRLDTILGTIKQKDYLLIQFGINDSAASKAERYAPTCGKVPGTAGSFEDYMAKYIEGAKAKGATPVLVTTVIGLKSFDSKSKKFVGSYSNYCNAMKQLASYYNIPCIDLNSLMVAHYNSIGYDAAYKYHMCSTGSSDMTHFTEAGAKAVAKLVADEMKKQGLV